MMESQQNRIEFVTRPDQRQGQMQRQLLPRNSCPKPLPLHSFSPHPLLSSQEVVRSRSPLNTSRSPLLPPAADTPLPPRSPNSSPSRHRPHLRKSPPLWQLPQLLLDSSTSQLG